MPGEPARLVLVHRGGCVSSCTSDANRSIDLGDVIDKLELDQSSLTGVCKWVKALDAKWGCHVRGSVTLSARSAGYTRGSTFGDLLEELAEDYGQCVLINETKQEIEFAPPECK